SLTVEGLDFSYSRHRRVFSNLGFHASTATDAGKIVAIMGTSGGGKTTLLRLISGGERPSAGRITYEPTLPPISYLSQEPVLLDHLRKDQSVAIFKTVAAYKHAYDQARLDRMVERLGLRAALESSAELSRLSGGEKQRLCLARALSIRPQILLL